MDIGVDALLKITEDLRNGADRLRFSGSVACVYNPLRYARVPHEMYLRRFARRKVTLLVGMNPGPFGMAQTGVPFGDVTMVRDFLGIEGPVDTPTPMHPKRPVQGFSCLRNEVSGRRLWTFAKERFGTAEAFFAHFFVVNYCPLVFMAQSGANITPDKLLKFETDALFSICDLALRDTVTALEAGVVVGIGEFARKTCARVLSGSAVRVGTVLHPSPASPAANRGWAVQAAAQLHALGVFSQ